MKIRDYIKKILSLGLVTILLLNSSGCLKRVPVPLENTQEVENDDLIYVTLKSGIEHKLRKPKFEDEFLTGITQNKEVKIPINEIKNH